MFILSATVYLVKMNDSIEDRVQDLEDFFEKVVKKLKEQTLEIRDLSGTINELTDLYSYPDDEFFYMKNVCISSLLASLD